MTMYQNLEDDTSDGFADAMFKRFNLDKSWPSPRENGGRQTGKTMYSNFLTLWEFLNDHNIVLIYRQVDKLTFVKENERYKWHTNHKWTNSNHKWMAEQAKHYLGNLAEITSDVIKWKDV